MQNRLGCDGESCHGPLLGIGVPCKCRRFGGSSAIAVNLSAEASPERRRWCCSVRNVPDHRGVILCRFLSVWGAVARRVAWAKGWGVLRPTAEKVINPPWFLGSARRALSKPAPCGWTRTGLLFEDLLRGRRTGQRVRPPLPSEKRKVVDGTISEHSMTRNDQQLGGTYLCEVR